MITKKILSKEEKAKKLISHMKMVAEQNVMYQNFVRGETKIIICTGDRDTGKTTTALYIAYERIKYGELFCYVVFHGKMRAKSTAWFIGMGFTVVNDIIYNNNEEVGYIADISNINTTKQEGYRNFNITTIIVEEVVQELKKTPANIGEKISSSLCSIIGKRRLKNWSELGIVIIFLTNNVSNNHPIFYLYGVPHEKIRFKYNKKICLINLVGEEEEIDPLFTLGDYHKLAYSNNIKLDDSILIKNDINIKDWDYVLNFKIFNTEATIYKNDEFLLISNIEKENSNKEIINLTPKDNLNKTNLNILYNLKDLFITKKLKFGDWKYKEILISAFSYL